MLVLSRKRGEKIVLPEQGVVLTILDIRREKVRVGITAPAEVPVFRSEVWASICSEQELAGAALDADVSAAGAAEPR
jgi:carbon storage regulator